MRCFARRGTPAFLVAASCRYNAAVAASTGVPAAAVNLANPYYLTWGHLNGVERARWERLWEKNDHAVDFNAIRHDLAAGKVKPAAFSGKLSDAVAKAKSVADLANIVEAALVPVRVLEKEREALQLQIWGLSDLIYLGLSASKPAQIEAYKVDLAKSKADLAANRKKAADYIAATFDTDSFNAVINIFRIAGEDDARALEYAGRLLDDMSQLLNLPFNTATQLLLKSVVFGDAPHEDSNVLFTFVENPERGEVSAAKDGDLTKISDDAMKTLSQRHTTPLTDGKLLRQTDTHPMLQRSPE